MFDRRSALPLNVCFSMPYGKVPLHGCSQRLLEVKQVGVMSVIEVLDSETVPNDAPLDLQYTVSEVGAVKLLLQFSVVPHLGFCPST